MKSSSIFAILVLLIVGPYLTTGFRLSKRQTSGSSPYGSASSWSSGTIPNGAISLSNNAHTHYSIQDSFSASASSQNSANGPHAVISSSSSANVATGALAPGSSIYGIGNGLSQGTAASGELANNDYGHLFLGADYINAIGASSIFGSGNQVNIQSNATSNMMPQVASVSSNLVNSPKHGLKSFRAAVSGPFVGAGAISGGSTPVGNASLNNNADSFFQFNSVNKPVMSGTGSSQNTVIGTNIVIQSQAAANGATGSFGSLNLVGNANAATQGQAATGNLQDSHSANVSSQPGINAHGTGQSSIQGSGTAVQVQSNAGSNVTNMLAVTNLKAAQLNVQGRRRTQRPGVLVGFQKLVVRKSSSNSYQRPNVRVRPATPKLETVPQPQRNVIKLRNL